MDSFTAVVTTGIYCRPGCPGTPLPRNTRAFAFAAAAEAAGFRPCLRCRPDRLPQPGWIEAPELVCRAMRAIASGALDGQTEDMLAARLGVSGRHLRRLFDAHIGATPSEVARSRRAHFARRLLDDTDLPIASVSEAAGFTSVRQMNRVMKDVFHFTPLELRARRRKPDRCVADGGLELRLNYRAPLAWETMLAFLEPRAIPGVESIDVDAGVYRRTIELSGAPGAIEVWNEPTSDALRMRAHLPEVESLVHVVAGVRKLFDLDADPAPIDATLERDRALRPMVRRRPGVRVPGAFDPFEIGVRAVLGQQVSVAAATTLSGRLVSAFGRPVPGLDALALTSLFPQADTLASADLTVIGLPQRRADAINAFARAVGSGEIDLRNARNLPDVVAALRALPGFGDWTANYVAMRACAERDAFPAGDLGLRRVLGPDTAVRAEAWRPWRAYGAMHVWVSSSDAPASRHRASGRSPRPSGSR